MKFKLKYSRFVFTDEKNNQYDIICPASKWQNNVFNVYKNGEKIDTYQPNGGHVNKTVALMILRKTIKL